MPRVFARLRWLRWPLLIVAAYLTVHIVVQQTQRLRSRQALAAALAATEAADPHWTLEAMEAHRRVVPDERNAALVIRDFFAAHSAKSFTDDEANSFIGYPAVSRLTDAQRALLAAKFPPDDPRRAAARRLADFPQGRHRIAYTANPLNTMLPHVQHCRDLATMLKYDALDLLDHGNTDEAIRAWRAMVNVERSLGDEPIVITVLVRLAYRSIAFDLNERILAQRRLTSPQLALLQAELQAAGQFDPFAAAMRYERAMSDATIAYVAGTRGGLAAVAGRTPDDFDARLTDAIAWCTLDFSLQRIENLESANRLVAIGRLPESEQGDAVQEWVGGVESLSLLPRLLAPAVPKLLAAARRDAARSRAAMTLVACERYRLRTGHVPAALTDLVAAGDLAAVPADPFTDGPLLLRHRPSALVVYSVGDDGTDDGGRFDANTFNQAGYDYAFVLWHPSVRRQPPLPPPPPDAIP